MTPVHVIEIKTKEDTTTIYLHQHFSLCVAEQSRCTFLSYYAYKQSYDTIMYGMDLDHIIIRADCVCS